MKSEFRNIAWDGIFASLESGQANVIASCVTITDKRKKAYVFSDPYYDCLLYTSQVVRASRRDLDSALGVLLPLDVGEVQNAPRGVVIGYGRLGGHQLAFTHEEPYGFVQRRRTIGGKPLDQGRFRGIFRGGDDALRAFVPGQHPKRQNAGHWLDRAAQGLSLIHI